MPVDERKSRRISVIEAGAAPAVGRVAGAALGATAALVHIIYSVAIDAIARRLVKAVSLMAITAGDVAVSAGEGIAG